MGLKKFQDKVVIITGSSRGIGKATAIEFIKQGASVVINGRDNIRLLETEKELKAFGGKVLAFCGDISEPDLAQALIEATIETFERLDILINNAGVSMRGDFADLKPEVFNAVFNTNIFGVTNLSIPAMPHLRASKGSLVFVSSLAGIRGLPGLSAYCSSKMALRAIAESIRIEESKTGMHVGLVQVGFTEIEFEKQTIAANGELITIKDRSKFKVQTTKSVAEAILKNVKRRKFITTLSPIGKLNAIMQSVLPGLVEKILIRSVDKIKKRS